MSTLLHICCAPCSVACIKMLREEGAEPVGFWYNPNIHPFLEYKARRDTLRQYAQDIGLDLREEDFYGLRQFTAAVAQDSGHRCGYCYTCRMERTAQHAAENGFTQFSTTLLVSPYQNRDLICATGAKMGEKYGVEFVPYDFRPRFQEGQEEARTLGLYMQKYCGCVYSEEDRFSNRRKKELHKLHKAQARGEHPVLKEGRIYPAVIDSYASGGEGVARIEGMAVFVKGALRGERADVFIEHIGHSAAWGHIEKLTEPSLTRIQPDCPYYGSCGGCQFRHMAYEEELGAKRQRVEDALRRIGGADLPVSVIHGAKNTYRYRNKVQFPVSNSAVGYYQGRTHKVVDISDCLLQPELDTVCRTTVKEWMERSHVSAYDEGTGKGLVRHLFLRTNSAGEVLCCVVVNGTSLPHEDELVTALRTAAPTLAGVVLSVNTRKTNVILGNEYRTLWGRDWLEETLCGHIFRLSAPSFFQVNREQTEVLYRRALEFAALTGTETVVELYCGIGAISLTLSEQAKQVIGVEVVPQAVADARENAKRNGLEGRARFECGDAGVLAAQLAAEGIRPDVVVVDPPRKGLASEVVDTIARMAPNRIVYVSCDPATLARDIKRFAPMGYEPVKAEAVDLFPRTAHVETVVMLSHKKPDSVINVKVEFGEGEGKVPLDNIAKRAAAYKPKERVTYKMIKEYIEAKYGFKVHTAYIAEVKRELGLPMYDAPNAVEELKQPRKHPTAEKAEAIKDALKHFEVI